MMQTLIQLSPAGQVAAIIMGGIVIIALAWAVVLLIATL